jgi:hypothetical protein
VDIPTGLPLFYRREGNAEVFVRFLDANTEASPMTILDSDAYSALTAATNYGLNLGEIKHQEAPIRGNSDTLAKIATGEVEPVITQAQSDAGWPWEKPTLVDGSTFTAPALVLGAFILLAAIVYAVGRKLGG